MSTWKGTASDRQVNHQHLVSIPIANDTAPRHHVRRQKPVQSPKPQALPLSGRVPFRPGVASGGS
eukprot:3033966-Rhodomonas_salina.6